MSELGRDVLRARLGARKTKTVDVPEWGGSVTLRELSAAQRFSIGESADKLVADHDVSRTFAMAAILVAESIVDGDAPVFSLADTLAFGASDMPAITRIAEEAANFNALVSAEENLGNSNGQPTVDSPSASA